MTLANALLGLFLAQTAYGQASFVDLGDTPTPKARPTTVREVVEAAPQPTPARATVPKREQREEVPTPPRRDQALNTKGKRVTPPKSEDNFPQCSQGKYTNNAADLQKMAEKILGITNVFRRTVSEKEPCKGMGCATFRIGSSAGTIQLNIQVGTMGSGQAAAQVCQSGNSIRAKISSDQGNMELVIAPISARAVQITGNTGNFSNTYTVR